MDPSGQNKALGERHRRYLPYDSPALVSARARGPDLHRLHGWRARPASTRFESRASLRCVYNDASNAATGVFDASAGGMMRCNIRSAVSASCHSGTARTFSTAVVVATARGVLFGSGRVWATASSR